MSKSLKTYEYIETLNFDNHLYEKKFKIIDIAPYIIDEKIKTIEELEKLSDKDNIKSVFEKLDKAILNYSSDFEKRLAVFVDNQSFEISDFVKGVVDFNEKDKNEDKDENKKSTKEDTQAYLKNIIGQNNFKEDFIKYLLKKRKNFLTNINSTEDTDEIISDINKRAYEIAFVNECSEDSVELNQMKENFIEYMNLLVADSQQGETYTEKKQDDSDECCLDKDCSDNDDEENDDSDNYYHLYELRQEKERLEEKDTAEPKCLAGEKTICFFDKRINYDLYVRILYLVVKGINITSTNNKSKKSKSEFQIFKNISNGYIEDGKYYSIKRNFISYFKDLLFKRKNDSSNKTPKNVEFIDFENFDKYGSHHDEYDVDDSGISRDELKKILDAHGITKFLISSGVPVPNVKCLIFSLSIVNMYREKEPNKDKYVNNYILKIKKGEEEKTYDVLFGAIDEEYLSYYITDCNELHDVNQFKNEFINVGEKIVGDDYQDAEEKASMIKTLNKSFFNSSKNTLNSKTICYYSALPDNKYEKISESNSSKKIKQLKLSIFGE